MFFLRQLIVTIIISISIRSIIILSPFTTGLYVLSIAILLALVTNIISIPWLAMVIFLVYIRGLLVVFAYFLAIEPNYLNQWKRFIISTALSFTVLFRFNYILKFVKQEDYTQERSKIIEPLYIIIIDNTVLLIFIGIILFLVLITVVKTVDLKKGSLRPFIN